MTSRSSSARPLTNQKGYITLPTKLANYDQNAPQRKCSEPSIYRMMARAQQPLLSLNTLPSLEFFLCCRHPSLQRCHCYRRCCSKLWLVQRFHATGPLCRWTWSGRDNYNFWRDAAKGYTLFMESIHQRIGGWEKNGSRLEVEDDFSSVLFDPISPASLVPLSLPAPSESTSWAKPMYNYQQLKPSPWGTMDVILPAWQNIACVSISIDEVPFSALYLGKEEAPSHAPLALTMVTSINTERTVEGTPRSQVPHSGLRTKMWMDRNSNIVYASSNSLLFVNRTCNELLKWVTQKDWTIHLNCMACLFQLPCCWFGCVNSSKSNK